MQLKLFVWEGVLCDYTCGLAVAIAPTKEEAIEVLTKDHCCSYARGELQAVEPEVIVLDDTLEIQGWMVEGGG